MFSVSEQVIEGIQCFVPLEDREVEMASCAVARIPHETDLLSLAHRLTHPHSKALEMTVESLEPTLMANDDVVSIRRVEARVRNGPGHGGPHRGAQGVSQIDPIVEGSDPGKGVTPRAKTTGDVSSRGIDEQFSRGLSQFPIRKCGAWKEDFLTRGNHRRG